MTPKASKADGVRRVVTDEAWGQLAPILGRLLSRRGAPPKLELREFLEAVLFCARTGVPWRDLPACFGTWDSVYGRFRRWQKKGRFEALWRELQAPAAAAAKAVFVDSTVVRAHPHAAGGPGSGGADAEAFGRSRGGFGTKVHLVAADERTALAVALTGGQRGDAPVFDAVMTQVPEETAAEAVVADRAYDSDKIRADLAAAGFEAVIPARRNRTEPIPHDAEKYKGREKAERLVGRLKRMRRVATRFDKLGCVFLAFVHLACVASILL
jgi:transposase